MQSKATTVREYLAALPADRRQAIEAVRKVILANLDDDYEEGMSYGMIGYYVPHSVFPPGYHCNPKLPLPFAALASQKNYMSLYLMSAYGEGNAEEQWLRAQFTKAGKKLDMGKCCIRFKQLEDLPLDVIGQAFRRVPAKKYVEQYQAALLTRGDSSASGTPAKKARGAPAAKAKPVKKPAARTAKR